MISTIHHRSQPGTTMIAEVPATLWTVLAAVAVPIAGVFAWFVKFQVKANSRQIAKLWAQHERMEKHMEFQDSTIVSLNAINATQNAEIAALQKSLSDSQNERHKLRNENNAMGLRLQELTAQNTEQAKQITELRGHIAKLERQINPSPPSVQT